MRFTVKINNTLEFALTDLVIAKERLVSIMVAERSE